MPSGDHGLPELEPLGRFGAVHYDLIPVQHVPPGVPDVLQAVDDASLVLRPLEDVAELRPRVGPYPVGHLLHLVPGLGGFGEAALLQQILPVVEHPGVGEPRDGPGLAVVLGRFDGAAQVLGLHPGRNAVREVQDVALGGELGRPDHVPPDHVDGGLPRLKLGLYLLEVVVARGGGRPPRNLDLAFMFLVEPVDKPLQAPRSIRPESKGDPHRTTSAHHHRNQPPRASPPPRARRPPTRETSSDSSRAHRTRSFPPQA